MSNKPWVFEKWYSIKEEHQDVTCAEILDKIHRNVLTLSPAKIVASGETIYCRNNSGHPGKQVLKDVAVGTKKSVIYSGLFNVQYTQPIFERVRNLLGLSYVEISCDVPERELSIKINCFATILEWMILASIFSIFFVPILLFFDTNLIGIIMLCGFFVFFVVMTIVKTLFSVSNILYVIRHIEEIKAW